MAQRSIVDALARALLAPIRAAFDQAGIDSRQLDHVNAHGMSTVDGDAWEAARIARGVGRTASAVTTFAPKSYFGSMSAAGSSVELIASVLSLRNGTLPATLNYRRPILLAR